MNRQDSPYPWVLACSTRFVFISDYASAASACSANSSRKCVPLPLLYERSSSKPRASGPARWEVSQSTPWHFSSDGRSPGLGCPKARRSVNPANPDSQPIRTVPSPWLGQRERCVPPRTRHTSADKYLCRTSVPYLSASDITKVRSS